MVDRERDQGGARRKRDRLNPRRRRSDAELNYGRIVEAAVLALRDDPGATIDQIATRSGIGRATIYRHFGSRGELVVIAERRAREEADANERDALRPPGELSGGPVSLNVADVLNKVPPHLVGEQIVAEVRRRGRVGSAALYLVDIDGSRLLRLAGSAEFPHVLPAPLAVGPELPRSSIPALRREIAGVLPGVGVAPLYLRGRAIGVLVALGAGEDQLLELARHAAAALELARPYTDALEMTRLHKDISPASEIQQNLLPPRIGRISGASVAGNVLPSYDVGGDWFDYVDNADGAWVGLADAVGVGPRAGALASIALGAFRAARRSGAGLAEAVEAMDTCLGEVGEGDTSVAALIGRWHGPTSTFSWINRAYPPPLVLTAAGALEALGDGDTPALGVSASESPRPQARRIVPGERLILCSDGVTDRPRDSGRRFGTEGVRAAAAGAPAESASATVKAIELAVLAASSSPLEDDAALVVLVPVGPQMMPPG